MILFYKKDYGMIMKRVMVMTAGVFVLAIAGYSFTGGEISSVRDGVGGITELRLLMNTLPIL